MASVTRGALKEIELPGAAVDPVSELASAVERGGVTAEGRKRSNGPNFFGYGVLIEEMGPPGGLSVISRSEDASLAEGATLAVPATGPPKEVMVITSGFLLSLPA